MNWSNVGIVAGCILIVDHADPDTRPVFRGKGVEWDAGRSMPMILWRPAWRMQGWVWEPRHFLFIRIPLWIPFLLVAAPTV